MGTLRQRQVRSLALDHTGLMWRLSPSSLPPVLVPCNHRAVGLQCMRVCSVAESCPTLWPYDPMECNSPGSSVHGISQARILQWVTIPSFRGSSWPRGWTQVSCVSCICFQADSLPPSHLGSSLVISTASRCAQPPAFHQWGTNYQYHLQVHWNNALVLGRSVAGAGIELMPAWRKRAAS